MLLMKEFVFQTYSLAPRRGFRTERRAVRVGHVRNGDFGMRTEPQMDDIWAKPSRVGNLSREVPGMEKFRMVMPPMGYLWLGPSRMG